MESFRSHDLRHICRTQGIRGELPGRTVGKGAEVVGCHPINRRHDLGMQRALEALLGRIQGSSAQVEMAQHTTTLPMRMGGLGLRSATRMAPGANWASWADVLHMLQERLPQLIRQVVHHISHPNALGYPGELQESASRLDLDSFVSRPSWDMLRRGVRPRPPSSPPIVGLRPTLAKPTLAKPTLVQKKLTDFGQP